MGSFGASSNNLIQIQCVWLSKCL